MKYFDAVKALFSKSAAASAGKKRYAEPVYREVAKVRTALVNYMPWDYGVRQYLRIDQETQLEMYVIIQKDGSLQITYGFRGHDIESFSKEYIAAVYEYANGQIKRLGDGWMVSVEAQRFEMHDYPTANYDNVAALLVEKEREAEFKNTGEHYDSSYYMTFVYKPENEMKKKLMQVFFKEPVREILIKDEIKKFLKTVENITAVLSARIIIRPLDCEETVCYLASTCSVARQSYILPDHFLFLDSFICHEQMEIGKTLRLGEYYIPMIEVYDFPTRSYPAILNDLNKLDVEYRWVSRYFPLSKESAMKELSNYQQSKSAEKKSSKQFASEMALGYESQLENHAASVEQGDVEAAQEEVGTEVNGLGYYQTSIMVWDKDYFAAIEKMKRVAAVVTEAGFAAKEEEFGAFECFKGMLAGNTTGNIRRPLVTSGNLVHTLPFSAIWSGIESNKYTNEVCGVDKPLITCATNYGANFYLNLNDGDVGHTLILGPTGSGKSTFLQLIEVSALKYPGVQVFILDYGLSALTLTLAVGGTYINPSDETVCFQPLRDVDQHDEFVWAVDYIKTIIEMNGVKLEPKMDVAIEAAMQAVAILPPDMRTIGSLKLNLQYTDERGHKILDDALKAYTIEGRYGSIFDGSHTSLSKNRWVLFEMEPIMNKGKLCSAPAILFIFHFLEKSFNGRLTFFVMDECWFGLDNPTIREKMKNYLLTLRKKNVFCIFATQNPAAVAESPMASTMMQNCPTKIYLADNQATENKENYLRLGLTEQEVNLIVMGTQKRDYYFKSPLGTRFFQLALGPIQLALFRGRETKFRTKSGQIIKWEEFQKYLLQEREKDGKVRAMVDEILDVQKVPFRKYLEGIDWESYL